MTRNGAPPPGVISAPPPPGPLLTVPRSPTGRRLCLPPAPPPARPPLTLARSQLSTFQFNPTTGVGNIAFGGSIVPGTGRTIFGYLHQ